MADKKDKKDKKPSSGGGSDGAWDIVLISFIFFGLATLFGGFFIYLFSPMELLLSIRDFFAPFFRENIALIQLISFILSALFLWGIIYIIIKTNYFEIKREQYLDWIGAGKVSKRRTLRAWNQILERMGTEDNNNWKMAILESDQVLNEILKMSGYLGDSMDEKLEILTPAQLSNIEDVKRAHSVRNRIAKDPTIEVEKKEVWEVMAVYEETFKQLNLINE